jgi:hypothetical protein
MLIFIEKKNKIVISINIEHYKVGSMYQYICIHSALNGPEDMRISYCRNCSHRARCTIYVQDIFDRGRAERSDTNMPF